LSTLRLVGENSIDDRREDGRASVENDDRVLDNLVT